MANSWLNTSVVLPRALLYIRENAMLLNKCDTSTQQTIAKGAHGQSVTVNIPGAFDANLIDDGTARTVTADIVPQTATLTVDKEIYVDVDMTDVEQRFNLDSFMDQVMIPALDSILAQAERFFLRRAVGGYMRNLYGTRGTELNSLGDVTKNKVSINTLMKKNASDVIALINPTAEANLGILKAFTSSDWGAGRPVDLRNGLLGDMANMPFFSNYHAAALNDDSLFEYYSNTAETSASIAVDGTTAVGATSIVLNGFSVAANRAYEGFSFTIAGDSTVYVSTADTDIAANSGTFSIYPALAAEAANDAVVTLLDAPSNNIFYAPQSFAGAMIAGSPTNNVSSLSLPGTPFGLSILESNTDRENHVTGWQLFTHVGAQVLQPNMGIVAQGGR
jgi:hypothetical protein